ncbi:phage/plasmid primase, P4 family [bacterium]|nr:phage/plasmid primase, P4 family [bacterium]
MDIGKEGNNIKIRAINEDFFAACLSDLGTPDAPVVFTQGAFYRYSAETGIFESISKGKVETMIGEIMRDCANACDNGGMNDVSPLRFRFTKKSMLSSIRQRVAALAEQPDDYFGENSEFIIFENGVLELETEKLVDFSPKYRSRNRIPFPFDSRAKCDLFLNKLLGEALDEDQIELLQKVCGLVLLGINKAEKVLLILGTAGGGKSKMLEVISTLIGQKNIRELRTQHLQKQFEIAAYRGKTWLIGSDVKPDFLMRDGASTIKALTGGDILTGEVKNGGHINIKGIFNVAISSNSILTVHLEQDSKAWERRLLVLKYAKPKTNNPDPELARKILENEAAGVLCWMYEGYKKLRENNFKVSLNERLTRDRDDILHASSALELFVRDRLVEKSGESTTKEAVNKLYHEYCKERGWPKGSAKSYPGRIEAEIELLFAAGVSNNIKPEDREDGVVKGWHGVGVKGEDM